MCIYRQVPSQQEQHRERNVSRQDLERAARVDREEQREESKNRFEEERGAELEVE